MKIGIATSVFVNYSFRDTIQAIASAGYDGVDVWGGRPHVYRQDFSRRELREIKNIIDDSDLIVNSFMPAFYRYPYSMSNPNPKVRKDTLDYMHCCLENALCLGAKILLVIPGKSLHNQSIDDARKRNIESINAICRLSSQYEISLGIEPANKVVTDLVNTAEEALEIIGQLQYSNLGVVLDTGHMHLNKEPFDQSVHRLGKHLLQIHINDNDGMRQQNLIPGEGTIDFLNLMSILKKLNFDRFLSLELAWDYASEPESAVNLALQRMQGFLFRI
jgi:protein FrlC